MASLQGCVIPVPCDFTELKAVLEDAFPLKEDQALASSLRDADFLRCTTYANWVMLVDGKIAGVVITHQEQGFIGIHYLGVSTNHRRKGLARKLMQHAIQALGSNRAQKFQLHVRVNNPAQHLYTSLGFKAVETHKNYYSEEELEVYGARDAYEMW